MKKKMPLLDHRHLAEMGVVNSNHDSMVKQQLQ
jgi:hypothetical protein